jgi:hypothetical protein
MIAEIVGMDGILQWKKAVIDPEINFSYVVETFDLESRESLGLAINFHFQSQLSECFNNDWQFLC